jgi:hypothetical protein
MTVTDASFKIAQWMSIAKIAIETELHTSTRGEGKSYRSEKTLPIIGNMIYAAGMTAKIQSGEIQSTPVSYEAPVCVWAMIVQLPQNPIGAQRPAVIQIFLP